MKNRHLVSLTATLIAALAANPATADSSTFAPWDAYTAPTSQVLVSGSGSTVDRPWFQQALDVDLRVVEGSSVAHPGAVIDFTPWFQKGQVAYSEASSNRDSELAAR